MNDHEIHDHHEHAAQHHEHAAKHHREAAKHHKAGNHEKAAHHSKIAHGHTCTLPSTRSTPPRNTQKSTTRSRW